MTAAAIDAVATPDFLVHHYTHGRKTVLYIATLVGCSPPAIIARLRKYGIEVRFPRGASGTAHPNWQGTNVSYKSAHARVNHMRGSPKHCDHCGTTDPIKRYDWASLTKNYADPNDYIRLCRKCHMALDDRMLRIKAHITHEGILRGAAKARAAFRAKQNATGRGRTLTIQQVHKIRKMRAAGKTFKAIAEALDIWQGSVYRIATYKSWAHIK